MAAQVAQLQQMFDDYKGAVDKSLNDRSKPWNKGFEMIEKQTNIPKIYIFFGVAAFCALYLIFGYGAQLLCNIIGVVYPAYVSIHAIESSTKLDDTKWLTYWVTYGVTTVIEYFSGIVTSIIPFYWLIKCIFLIWCMLPMEQNGAYVIYNRIIRPYFLKHHRTVDNVIDSAVGQAKQSVGSFLKTE